MADSKSAGLPDLPNPHLWRQKGGDSNSQPLVLETNTQPIVLPFYLSIYLFSRTSRSRNYESRAKFHVLGRNIYSCTSLGRHSTCSADIIIIVNLGTLAKRYGSFHFGILPSHNIPV